MADQLPIQPPIDKLPPPGPWSWATRFDDLIAEMQAANAPGQETRSRELAVTITEAETARLWLGRVQETWPILAEDGGEGRATTFSSGAGGLAPRQ